MNSTIRKYGSEDIPEITRVYNTAVEEGGSLLNENLLSEHEMSEILNTEKVVYVSLTDGIISGVYMIRENLKGRGSHIANATYVVSKNFRGNGIGQLLGRHSFETARDLGFTAMQFNSVVSTNVTAKTLWEKLGFKTIGVVPNGFRLKNGEFVDIHIMFRTF